LTIEAVVEGQFFSRPNLPPAEEEDVPASFSDSEIGIAAMIDEFCAASAHGAIDKAARVQAEEVELLNTSRAPDFVVADAELAEIEALAGIFHDSSAQRNRIGREYTNAVNSGAANPQAVIRDRRIN